MIRVVAVGLVAALVLGATGVAAVGAEKPKRGTGSKTTTKGIPPNFKAVTGGLETTRRPRSLRQKTRPRVPYIHPYDNPPSSLKINTPKGNQGSGFNPMRRKIEEGYNR